MSRHKTTSEWFELVATWEQSQMSAAAWCRQQGLGYQSFLHWRRRRREMANSDLALSDVGRFCEVLPTADSVLQADIAGVRLHLERGFDPELLRQVVAALREV